MNLNMKHLKYILFFISLMLVLASCKTRNRSLIREGNDFYTEKNYVQAAGKYLEAFKLDTTFSPASFNMGNALYKLQKYDSAILFYERIIPTIQNDSIVLAHVHYNLGNAELSKAIAYKKLSEQLLNQFIIEQNSVNETQDIREKVRLSIKADSVGVLFDSIGNASLKSFYNSIQKYKASLRITPMNDSARYNLVYAQQFLPKNEYDNQQNKDNQEQQLTLFAKRLKQQADSLVMRYVFDTAYNVMNTGVVKDTTVKQYNEYINKLKEVNDIKYKQQK